MDEFTLSGLLVLFSAVLPCLVLGYFIAFQGRRGLIAGWQEDKISDPEKAGRIIGISLMIMSVILAIITLLWFLHFFTEDELIYYLLPTTLLPLIASLYVHIKLKI
ncbi:DUF3784 domain-containing protein [Thalassotalea sp. SU-HH00458]|uniref:DUF3784 domain-containing protein n=1 Tax=Thalassotalea sp. SU-HH00458 TaxID=3127657 RepID=UPI00310C2E42